MHLNSHYAVRAGTMFRREDFGGIVYQRTGDRLHFIKSRLAMELLELAGTGTVLEIAARISAGAPAEQTMREHILTTLRRLEEMGIVHELEYQDGAPEGASVPDLADNR